MDTLQQILSCALGPKLYRLLKTASNSVRIVAFVTLCLCVVLLTRAPRVMS